MNHDNWKLAGLCNNEDPELFFPTASDRHKPRQAKAICNQCPVLVTCRTESLHEYFGVWGGLSENERRKLRRHNKTTQTAA